MAGQRDTSGFQLIDTPDYIRDAESRYNMTPTSQYWMNTGLTPSGLTAPLGRRDVPTELEWSAENVFGWNPYGYGTDGGNPADLVRGALNTNNLDYDFNMDMGVGFDDLAAAQMAQGQMIDPTGQLVPRTLSPYMDISQRWEPFGNSDLEWGSRPGPYSNQWSQPQQYNPVVAERLRLNDSARRRRRPRRRGPNRRMVGAGRRGGMGLADAYGRTLI